MVDHSAPEDYEQMFTRYWGHAVAVVRSAGIHPNNAEDVAAAILGRFWERDFLAVYDPGYRSERTRAQVSFTAFLTGFIKVYVRHYRERQIVYAAREYVGITPGYEPQVEPDPISAFEDALVSAQAGARYDAALAAAGLPGVWDLMMDLQASGRGLFGTQIARELGVSDEIGRGILARAREVLRAFRIAEQAAAA